MIRTSMGAAAALAATCLTPGSWGQTRRSGGRSSGRDPRSASRLGVGSTMNVLRDRRR